MEKSTERNPSKHYNFVYFYFCLFLTQQEEDISAAVAKPTSKQDIPKEKDDKYRIEKKGTVLETHGYTLGKTIGTGTYGTVKVNSSSFFEFQ